MTFSEVPDNKNADTDSTGIDDMNEASEIKCKKKLLGLLASWVRLTTCSTLVKVRILLRIVKFGIEFFLTIFCD